MKTKELNLKKGGFVVPVAIAVLVAASIGLLAFSWWGGAKKEQAMSNKTITTR